MINFGHLIILLLLLKFQVKSLKNQKLKKVYHKNIRNYKIKLKFNK